jgi:hypothetical protein
MKEDQLREDQRREALARKEQEPQGEETLPPPAARRFEEAPAPRIEEPPAPRVEEPRIDSKALLESAGLVMIETDRSRAPSAPAEEPTQQLGRPRRERAKAAPQEEELQQVETRK